MTSQCIHVKDGLKLVTLLCNHSLSAASSLVLKDCFYLSGINEV